MTNFIKTNIQEYHKVIMDKLGDFSYRRDRYNLDFSIAIGFSDDNVDLEGFISLKRRTDEFIVLKENLCCVILDGTNSDSAIKAASNMQTKFQTMYFGKKLFISVVTAKDYESDNEMLNSLFNLLNYSIENNMNGLVIDQSQIMNCKFDISV